MEQPVERVKAERRRRGWSIRTAAAAGDISNQTWSVFERTGVLSNGIQRAVVAAFGWPTTWVEQGADMTPQSVTRLDRLEDAVRDLQAAVERLQGD